MAYAMAMRQEPSEELSPDARSFARMIASLIEEAQAIGSYEQRTALEPDLQARAILSEAAQASYRHFCLQLEWLLRASPEWAQVAQAILFREGEIGARTEAPSSDPTSPAPTFTPLGAVANSVQ